MNRALLDAGDELNAVDYVARDRRSCASWSRRIVAFLGDYDLAADADARAAARRRSAR